MTHTRRTWLAVAVLAAAALLMIAGALRGETQQVWIKASNICMECIGLG